MTPGSTTLPVNEDVIERVRSEFPSLARDTVFLENAGGSQVPRSVIEAISTYFETSYAQLDADYPESRAATATVADAHAFIEMFMNADDRGRVILGPSSTALMNMLAACYRKTISPGDEFVIAECGHETNVGPWVRLAEEAGATVRWWRVNCETTSSDIAALEDVLNEQTRFVCFPHVSNLLGEIIDVPGAVAAARSVGARTIVDGVAYAPHRAVDVSSWNVDYYFYSTYKVYGPHMAALFGTSDALSEITGPNHFFIDDDDVPYKFEPGGVSHEGCAGLLGLRPYLNLIAGHPADHSVDRQTIERAFDTMTSLELPLQSRLVDYLVSKNGRIVGPAHGESSRVGTVSFVHPTKSSAEISTHVTDHGIGIRHGHMYAYRLCEALGIDPDDGVVRISLVHYNTMDEIDRLIAVLDGVL